MGFQSCSRLYEKNKSTFPESKWTVHMGQSSFARGNSLLVPQPLSRHEEQEGVKTFKELRAKFQKYDAPPFPGPIKFSAGVSRKDDRGHPQPAQSLASSNNLSSHHHRPLSYSLTEVSKPLKSQKMKLAQKGEIQKNSSSSGPPGKSAECPARNSQKAAMPLDASKPKAGTPNEEKGMNVSSFRYKLWNWEKFSSQKSEISPASPLTNCGSRTFHLEGQKTMGSVQIKPEKSPEATGVQTLPPQSHLMVQRTSPVALEASPLPLPQHDRKETDSPNAEESPTSSLCQPVYECELTIPVPEKPESRRHQLPKTKPLPSIETLGPPPPKPSKPPFVNLQAFQRQPTVVSKTLKEVTVKEGPLPPEGAELEEPHNYDTRISYLSHSSNSINLCAAGETAEATYEIEIEELQKPWRSFPHLEPRPTLKDEENSMQEKESYELEPPKPEDSHPKHPSKVGVYEETPGKVQMAGVQGDRWSLPAGNQEAVVDINQNKLFPEDVVLTRHSQEKGGYVEALEVTKETPSSSTTRSDSSSEKTYDDVGCSREELPKWDFSSSFTSDSEDNSEEMYEDIYKAKNNDQKPEVDGRAALRRLQQLFGKEKGIFRMRKTKSKENVSNGFSMSLPDLGLRSQDVIIYDDVDTSDKESKDEDKPKTWKPKFLTSKGKRGKKSSDGSKSFSPKNFFRAKKHNLEKNRMEKEEKLFRERFQYGKEIVVINRAVACSSNSRNGIFDLPITPGEQLEVIDTTEQNLVICRNSKGKYGYVLIEHLHFK
ncbi:FYN-binding protein 2 isoform X1 [Cricetulus griseus]|uniref:FYN-binding protein 2 isoform X1 n=1 Tax=Cricetulus griseus TaxID=10029 RepID=UPI0015C32CA8|nr:FYN-binding protein 2 isoform X1 [Cricetulus griseus]